MRRGKVLLIWLLLLALTGCTGKRPVSSPGAPAPAPAPPPPAQEPAAATGPRVVKEGAALRLKGLPEANRIDWSPSGQTALIQTFSGYFRLRLDSLELHPLAELSSINLMGWAGPDTALVRRWSGQPAVGELHLLTGAWRPQAAIARPVAICQGDTHWTWIDVTSVMSGGGGDREIGRVYRTPTPSPVESGNLPPLTGELVLEQGALLGRLADGSCLLDGLDRRLLLLRPNGDLQTLTHEFSLPRVTRDGQGVVWLEQAGPCDYCIEVGSGMPFRRLVWWRLDSDRLTADLGRPQVISYLLSPDGNRLIIGHRDMDGTAGAISTLSAEGFVPGQRQDPVRAPAGWMGANLLTQPSGPERWQAKSPVFREDGAEPVAQWLANGPDGGLLVLIDGETAYLSPEGDEYRLSHRVDDSLSLVGMPIAAQAPYLAVRQGDGLLLARLDLRQ